MVDAEAVATDAKRAKYCSWISLSGMSRQTAWMGTFMLDAPSFGCAGRALRLEMTLAAIFGSRSWDLTRAISYLETGLVLFDFESGGLLC